MKGTAVIRVLDECLAEADALLSDLDQLDRDIATALAAWQQIRSEVEALHAD